MREPFDSATTYHIYNRGVDHRTIFTTEDDFQRFYESLYLFNDKNYRRLTGGAIDREVQLANQEIAVLDRDPLVQIQAFCLMNNHYHLLLRQLHPEGISKFLHRVAMGYTKYFNLKHERTGRLFESSYQLKPADHEGHMEHLPRYIHLNALDGTTFSWRDGQTPDWDKALVALEKYPWSSHSAYMQNPQTLPVVDELFVTTTFPSPTEYVAYLTRLGVSR